MANHKGLILDVDLRSRKNNLAHRTKKIDQKRLIVRRGQRFSIALHCNGPLPPRHQLELVLHLGKRDEVVIKVQKVRGAGDGWWFNQQGAQNEMLLTLHSPADAIIGKYSLDVLMKSLEGHIIVKRDKISFYLLYNPWCKDDVVYLSKKTLLQEYIMNENGIIYRGAWNYIQSSHWNYGQFEDDVIDICFKVLDNSNDALKNSKEDIEQRSNPVHVSRVITAMVNSNDDRGVLTGRWNKPYSGGVAPYQWTGSVPILRQWNKFGTKAVKYGQCWVFAAVACTVLRCLGIPTRHITNFNSGHDVDGNLSIDVFFNEKLEAIENKRRSDSTWNFHCWVESWMRRDDLPKGNNGWQVLDPTPQELSDGVFCCGPCPVRAIKKGNLGVKYDAKFVFAEVNADIIHWIKKDGQQRKIKADHTSVGRKISTKSAYGDSREDVTLHYKYPEGSRKEREVYKKAGGQVEERTSNSAKPARLQLSIKHAKPVYGTDFDVIIKVRNKRGKDVQVQLTVLAMAVTYTSVHRREFQRQRTTVKVPAHKAHKEVLHLHYADYAKCFSNDDLLRVTAFIEAAGNNEPIMAVTNIPLSRPKVFIQVPGTAFVCKQVKAHFSFTNHLPVPLKGGVFTVEGAGLLSATDIPVKGDIAPGKKVSSEYSFSPMRTGVRKLLVDFHSDGLKDVKGVATVVVRKKIKRKYISQTRQRY